MRAEADLSLRGQVHLLAEFLDRLELQEVTLVFNDWCGAQLLIAEGWDRRVARLVFATGPWFAAAGRETFYPEVVVTVTLDGGHFHLPLLLSPYAYSTYRGS